VGLKSVREREEGSRWVLRFKKMGSRSIPLIALLHICGVNHCASARVAARRAGVWAREEAPGRVRVASSLSCRLR
jgi:hypothetical protein